ncbi:MAG: 50S ribosomal protein L32 [Bacteroidia bacterium]
MAHPKRKISKTRRDKRRTHFKSAAPTLSIDSTTGETHERHRAHENDGVLYYRGKAVMNISDEV